MFRKISCIFIFFLILLLASDTYALLHYFKNAKKAEETGDYDKALSLYNRVLERHPYEIKSVLRAYDHILRIYKIRKDNQRIKEILTHLKNNYPNQFFDLKDIEKLSLIYSRYGEKDESLRLQWKIIETPSTPHIKAVLRTYSRLLRYYRERGDKAQVDNLLRRLSFLPINEFDETDMYKYAILNLDYGERDRAKGILKRIIDVYPHTTSSRKAIFILAEDAQRAKDYDTAIGYYSLYIERYPENTFYVQKAYQRIVDCYLAKGERRLSEELMKQVTDWLNGVSDYRSQLNLAIDLKSKNMDRLADVTFNTGYHEAKRVITENPGTYDALKAHLEITRAAHPLGRTDIAQESATAILRDFTHLKGDTEFQRNVDSIRSQAYLWLARIYKEQKRYDDTIKMLEDFLRLYPEHKDRDYAMYEMGRAYEETGNLMKAKEFYSNIHTEPLRSMAQKRLMEMR